MKFSAKKFQENLIKLMSIQNISGYELHKNTGVPASTIQRLCSEKNTNPTISTLKPIADFFSISINQLIGDTPLQNEYPTGINFPKHGTWRNIPIIAWQEVLTWLSENIDITNKPVVSTDINVGKNVFALEIPNNDWVGFRKGSVLIVDPDAPPIDRGFVIASKTELDSTTMKKYLLYDGEVYLEPLNKIFKTVELSNDFTILGTVIHLKLDFNKENCI